MHIEIHGRTVEIDDEGFLVNLNEWNEDICEALIERHEADGHIPVTEAARDMIGCFRAYYRINKVHPSLYKLGLIEKKRRGNGSYDQKAYKAFLYGLFPHGPVHMLCKLAGLPKPTDELQ